ncbi:SRPBCC family protein [Flagellimonas lutimaris]|jgi:ligand-binding SRPBCC domain-containing protein|uniref:SRPBCC family protein n=1 Tax=Flagellimonas lutimaris TaxID=475082 RepID=UPI0039C289A9
MPKIELKTKIKSNKEIVFDLSRSIDLHKISTEQTKEEAIEGKVSGLIGYGEWVTWRAKHFGIYQTLTSKIIEFERPHFFVDEMVKGAFASFRHQHNFKEFDYGTLMIDYFEYKSPLGLLGKLADSLFLKKYMKTLLEKRNQTIKEFAESELWKQLLKT